MARLTPISIDKMTADQRRVREIVVSTRKGGLGGPFSVWARVPDLAEPANLLHNAFRLNGTLDRRIFETMILVVAHEFRARYVWAHHVQQALSVGVEREVIEAIEKGEAPAFTRPDEQIAFKAVKALLRSKTLDDSLFSLARETFGEALLIELVSAVGFYSMVSIVVNTFDVPAPGEKSM